MTDRNERDGHDDVPALLGDPVYTPPGQSILPGFKGDISQRPIDWRQWTDAHGNKIDSPAYKGRTSSGGKTIPPLIGSDGLPIRAGSFQVLRDVRGAFIVVDWQKTMFVSDERGPEVPGDPDAADDSATTPIMGRVVYRTTKDLARAIAGMRALHKDASDKAAGLPEDPTAVFDLAGTRIQIGRLSLRRFGRGGYAGRYAVVDESVSVADEHRIRLLKATTLKTATGAFCTLAQKLATSAPKRRRLVGAPMSFSAPSNFGSTWVPDWERDLPRPGSPSWRTCVRRYAQTGKWCDSAWFPTGRPPDLVTEAEAAREAFLREPEGLEDSSLSRAGASVSKKARRKLQKGDRDLLATVLGHFEGATLTSLITKEGG